MKLYAVVISVRYVRRNGARWQFRIKHFQIPPKTNFQLPKKSLRRPFEVHLIEWQDISKPTALSPELEAIHEGNNVKTEARLEI